MTAEGITIRAAKEPDLTELCELIREHAHYEGAEEVRPDLQLALRIWLFPQHPRTHVLVAARDEEIIGYASWSMEASTWQAGEYAHLDCLYLRDTARGHGIGRALMDGLEVDARAAGATELQWQTPEWKPTPRASTVAPARVT